jgi:hypothetical protein
MSLVLLAILRLRVQSVVVSLRVADSRLVWTSWTSPSRTLVRLRRCGREGRSSRRAMAAPRPRRTCKSSRARPGCRWCWPPGRWRAGGRKGRRLAGRRPGDRFPAHERSDERGQELACGEIACDAGGEVLLELRAQAGRHLQDRSQWPWRPQRIAHPDEDSWRYRRLRRTPSWTMKRRRRLVDHGKVMGPRRWPGMPATLHACGRRAGANGHPADLGGAVRVVSNWDRRREGLSRPFQAPLARPARSRAPGEGLRRR